MIVAQLFVSGLLLGGVYMVLAVPLNLMFGTTRIVHFAYGEFLMISMFLNFWLFQKYGIGPYGGGFVLVGVLFVLFGLVVYKLIFARLVLASHMTQIMATLGLGIALQNLALMLWTADVRTVRTAYTTAAVEVGPIRLAVPLLIASLAGVLLTLAVYALLRFTYWGFAMRAVTQNVRAAEVVGIPPSKAFQVSIVTTTALLGVGGSFFLPVFFTSPTVGLEFAALAFVIVVLGGLGSISGGVLAAVLVGLVQSFSAYYIGIEWQTVVYFALFLVVLFVRPAGLMGQRGTEEMGIAI